MDIQTLYFDESFWCEELKASFIRGPYTPSSEKEYEALLPFASRSEAKPVQADTSGHGERLAALETSVAELKASVASLEAENAELKATLAEYESEEGQPDKAALVAEALALEIECESKLKRWSIPRLQEAIAAAKA